jgi:hypothetical protein
LLVAVLILVLLLVQLFLVSFEFFDLMFQLLSFALQDFKPLAQFVELFLGTLLENTPGLALLFSSRDFSASRAARLAGPAARAASRFACSLIFSISFVSSICFRAISA